MYNRLIRLDNIDRASFFIWGPRQVGKSSLLKTRFRDAYWIDLLKTDQFTKYATSPHYLREELLARPELKANVIVIDEIQKVPALLDEVHWLIENGGYQFALCGSSARKLKRGHANLLGGRAIRFELSGFIAMELGLDFDLVKMLNKGYLPPHYLSQQPKRKIQSYINDYLKEEIVAEALVQNLGKFSDFLRSAAIGDTEVVSYATIARECGVSNSTVSGYYEILVDTLLGRWLKPFTRREKRRVTKSPKFYLFDVGVVNGLAKRGEIFAKSELFGKAFENWLHHELVTYSQYSESFFELSFWQLSTQTEVDFIVGDMEVAIEAKATERIRSDHLKGLRTLIEDHPTVKKRIVVCCEPLPRKTDDGILILPYRDFIERLWSGEFC